MTQTTDLVRSLQRVSSGTTVRLRSVLPGGYEPGLLTVSYPESYRSSVTATDTICV